MTASNRSTRLSPAARHAPPEARKAGRMLAFAVIRREPSGWSDLAAWLTLGLPLTDRAALAFAALRALPPDVREIVAGAAFAADDERGGDDRL